VRPGEHAGHQQQPGTTQLVFAAGGAALDFDRVLGEFQLGMQIGQQRRDTAAGQPGRPVGHVRVEHCADLRPERLDGNLPVLTQRLGNARPATVLQHTRGLSREFAAPHVFEVCAHPRDRAFRDCRQLHVDRGERLARPGQQKAGHMRTRGGNDRAQ
jgi:hypothetical protein